MRALQPVKIGALSLKNAIVRSATFEGAADAEGCPTATTLEGYRQLAQGGVGAIITGFVAVTAEGRSMQPGQVLVDSPRPFAAYRDVVKAVHAENCRILMQLSHTGRQTHTLATGLPVKGVSSKASAYFGGTVSPLTTAEVWSLVEGFGQAAAWAQQAGFDGVQIHCAHGYLMHQFLSPVLNRRADAFGPDPVSGLGTALTERIVEAIRGRCGPEFGLWVKISGRDAHRDFSSIDPRSWVGVLDRLPIDLVEVSTDSMENPLNIFRGKTLPVDEILRHNPHYRLANPVLRWVYKHLLAPFLSRFVKKFTPCYNKEAALEVVGWTTKPVMVVGGITSGPQIEDLLESGLSLVGLCRPLIAQPDFVRRLAAEQTAKTTCVYCNLCAVYCDTPLQTRCFRRSPP